jgi:hypothetical protein
MVHFACRFDAAPSMMAMRRRQVLFVSPSGKVQLAVSVAF